MRVINCVCGYRLEIPDDGDVAVAMKAHSDQAHPELKFSEEQMRAMMAAHDARVSSWDGTTTRVDAPVELASVQSGSSRRSHGKAREQPGLSFMSPIRLSL